MSNSLLDVRDKVISNFLKNSKEQRIPIAVKWWWHAFSTNHTVYVEMDSRKLRGNVAKYRKT